MSVAGIAIIIFLIGAVDCLNGDEVSLGVFYLIPVVYSGWRMGRRRGVLFALLAGLTSMSADFIGGHAYHHSAVLYWNGVNRFAVGAAAAVFAGSLSHKVHEQRKLIFDLRRALLTLTEFSRQIPICPVCHRFRDDAEFRAEIANFIEQQSDPRAVGRICQECLTARQALFPSVETPADAGGLPTRQ